MTSPVSQPRNIPLCSGMVGGVAFFTLIVNGSLSGPLLRKLGLAESTATRKRIVTHFAKSTKDHLMGDLVHLMTDPRFKHIDFSVISSHVPIFKDITLEELSAAVEKNQASVPPDRYRRPDLSNILPYLLKKAEQEADTSMGGERPSLEEGNILFESYMNSAQVQQQKQGLDGEDGGAAESSEGDSIDWNGLVSVYATARIPVSPVDMRSALHKSIANTDLAGISDRAIELRLIFVEALRHAYAHQVERGELDPRGFLDYVLFQSLEFCADEVRLGKPLNDWEATQIVGGTWTSRVEIGINRLYSLDCRHRSDVRSISREYIQLRFEVSKALAFISAHTLAQERFQREFCVEGKGEFTAQERLVLEESLAQVRIAKAFLESKEKRDVTVIVSHLACIILLNKGARYMEYLAEEGLLKQKEAHHFIELTSRALDGLKYCSKSKHPGELTRAEKLAMMNLPSFCRNSRDFHYKPSSYYSSGGDERGGGTEKFEQAADDGGSDGASFHAQ
mmetsp:Transcript_662/g.1011  ORF Transcript_662/g.1011 Transcript_662/m.1011 type:complete len:507 (-) Transcript_662:573-2093(-)